MSDPLRIGIAGLGTVGVGTVKLLRQNKELLAERCGREIVVTAVSARDISIDRGVSLSDFTWHGDAVALATNENVDVVVELIGGSDGIARDLVEAALDNGKHVVTANKALVAHHGVALAMAAENGGLIMAYEAAVAGGIPIIKALREGLSANTIDHLYGILNGTCNYILTSMRETGKEFQVVLAEAQELGYAEVDPAFDVEGVDAAHKLSILASLAFGCRVNFDAVHVEGIRDVSPMDIEFAAELGYRIKLLGITCRTTNGIEQRVHPCMVPLDSPIAYVEDVFNAVVVHGDQVETTLYEGRGAGEGPTSSAVVADIADIACGRNSRTFGIPAGKLAKLQTVAMSERNGCYYARFTVIDKPGVFAEIAAALRDHDVSMEAVLQRGRAPGEPVSVVLTTHETREADMMATINTIDKTEAVVEPTRMIRIERF